jgi:transcriptional regulator with XRE-family HTH domain
MKIISENIRKVRGSLGLTQRAFAEKIGISVTHLNQVEKGAKNPSLPLILKISEVFDIDPGILLARKDSLLALKNLLSKNGISEIIEQLKKEINTDDLTKDT